MTAGLEGIIGIPARLLIEAVDVEGLGEMNAGIELAARQLATTRPDVAIYMCTSGSFKDGQDGNQAIKETLGRLIPAAKITTTSEAVVEAMRALDLRRVAMLTPYDEEVTRREIDFLGWHGVSVTDFIFRDIEDNLDRGAVPPDESYHFASQLDLSDADGTFLSCANVRAIEIIEELESRTGKPVVTSSQATTWRALRMAGVDTVLEGFGALLRIH